MDIFIVRVLNALLDASNLFLIAGGLSLIYGVMRLVNLAHGTIYAVGAYVAAWAVGALLRGGSANALYLLLLPAGAVAAGVLGAVLEPIFLRPLYKRAEEYQLLITFGLLLILDDAIRFIWGPHPLTATSLYAYFGGVNILGLRFPAYNLLVILIGFSAAVFLWAFVYKTKFGVLLRATSQDMRMASALGVNTKLVFVSAFALGCFMAGLGGAIIVPAQAAVLGMGVDALVLSFVVVVIGGLGSLEGALVGALIVGIVRAIAIALFPEIELALLYLIAAVVLLVRPAGLFGKA